MHSGTTFFTRKVNDNNHRTLIEILTNNFVHSLDKCLEEEVEVMHVVMSVIRFGVVSLRHSDYSLPLNLQSRWKTPLEIAVTN